MPDSSLSSQKNNEVITEVNPMTNEMPDIVARLGVNAIVGQIQNEYKLAYDFLVPKVEEWLIRLSLYNNQRRDKSKIGDPLLFTTLQTLLSVLYTDKLNVEFLPREEGDIEVAENLNTLAEFDFSEMDKSMVDYEWMFNSLFFGRGLLLLQTFDRELMHPVPEVIDPLSFYRDPKAHSANGDIKGNNGLRFWGREVSKTKLAMKKNSTYFNLDVLKTGRELQSFIEKARRARRDAQGLMTQPFQEDGDFHTTPAYDVLEWYTHLEGEKYLVTLGNFRSTIIRAVKMKGDRWPLIDRPLFPISHNWDGVSVPDLVEDKQRARAVLENLGLESSKADLYPMYVFDETKIKNTADLNFGFNKFIRSSGAVAGAVEPLNKPTVHQQVSYIMELLSTSAEKALATPEVSQGVTPEADRTLGETALVSRGASSRHSLTAKIFGWSEKNFWRQWYFLYKNHFADGIDKKITRISGVFGPEFRELKKDNIIARVDPDIIIEGKVDAEVQMMRDRRDFTSFIFPLLNDPNTNRRYAFKEGARLSRISKEKIDMLFPPTLDEMDAERENDEMEEGKKPIAEILEDHQTHIAIHAKLNESKVRDAHVEAHKKGMYLKRENVRLFAENEAAERPGIRPLGPTEERQAAGNPPRGTKSETVGSSLPTPSVK